MIKIKYGDDPDFEAVYSWLENNCKGKWYSGWDWKNWQPEYGLNRMVEFEDPHDATLFILRWV